MHVVVRRILLVMLALLVVAMVVYAFRPEPVPVDVREVSRGPMRVTVDEEGQTRIKDRYVVSAPLGGRLRRIALDPGDAVDAEQTVVATIEPTDPALLDARARSEAEARVRAAAAAVQHAGANMERARSAFDLAEDEHARAQAAFERGGATPIELDIRETLYKTRREEYRAAQFAEDIARYELDLARSALLHTQPASDTEDRLHFRILAPISGRVLRVFQESVAVISPGTPLLEVGDPTDLEVVIDVLSTDAVRIEPGAEIIIEHWGGDHALRAAVRLIEPSAFTKVSALGVEEQRVNVIADFVSPFEERRTLGDGFRVEGRIVLWEGADVVRVPTSALFRNKDNEWTVFAVVDGRAVRRLVEIGHQNGLVAEVLAGLDPGAAVIVHPSDRVADRTPVEPRETS